MPAQAAAGAALLGALHAKHGLSWPGREDISRLTDFAGPVGAPGLPIACWRAGWMLCVRHSLTCGPCTVLHVAAAVHFSCWCSRACKVHAAHSIVPARDSLPGRCLPAAQAFWRCALQPLPAPLQWRLLLK